MRYWAPLSVRRKAVAAYVITTRRLRPTYSNLKRFFSTDNSVFDRIRDDV